MPDTGTDGNTSSGTDNGAEDSTGGNSGEQGATVWIRPDLDIVTIYQNQNLNGRMVATLSGGASLTLLQDMGGGVYRVRLPSGQTGYVSASYVSFTQSSAAEDNPAAPEYTVYTVKAGDNLWNIATAYLGSGARYPEIMQLKRADQPRNIPRYAAAPPCRRPAGIYRCAGGFPLEDCQGIPGRRRPLPRDYAA